MPAVYAVSCRLYVKCANVNCKKKMYVEFLQNCHMMSEFQSISFEKHNRAALLQCRCPWTALKVMSH